MLYPAPPGGWRFFVPVCLMPDVVLEPRWLQVLKALRPLQQRGARFHAWVGMGRLRLAVESG